MRKNLFFFIKFTNLNYERDLNKVNEAVKEVTKYFRMELVAAAGWIKNLQLK